MSTDLPIPVPTPRPTVPPDGEPELPRETDELGDDEDPPTEPGTAGDDPPADEDEPAPWPSSAPAESQPMTFRDADGRVHLVEDMRPSDQRRVDEATAIGPAPALLRS